MSCRPSWALSKLFTPVDVAAAFAVMADPYGCLSTSPALTAFASQRAARAHGGRKQHLDIPLAALAAGGGVRAALAPEILHIYDGLLHHAVRYVEAALQHPSVPAEARDGVLDDLGQRSVLRLLRYEHGVGCRPHVDPGLCTCLLLGSQGGLEVNTSGTDGGGVWVKGRPGNYRYDGADGMGDAEGCNRLDRLPGWQSVAPTAITASSAACEDGGVCDTAAMDGHMLHVLSRGAVQGVLHRVRYDWAEDGPGAAPLAVPRCNIIVELRPAKPKRWFKLMAQPRPDGDGA